MGIIGRIIGYPLGFIIWLAYLVTGNYALSIVIFTVITRILLFPISVKQQKSSAATQALAPKLEKLKKQYANNPTKMQEAQMALYEEEGVNPMASCLPLMIQLPILYGVFDVVYRPLTHILRFSNDIINQASKICQGIEAYADIKAFSSRAELYLLQALNIPENQTLFAGIGDDFLNKTLEFSRQNKLFGFIDLSVTPSLKPEVWTAETIGLAAIPFISGILYLVQSIYMMVRQKKTNPEAAKAMGSMSAMMLMTPVFSVWVAFSAPAALGFYWAVSAVIGLVQTIILNKIYTPEYVAKLIEKDKKKKKNKKKSGLMQRYQEMLAQQAEAMGQQPDGRTYVRTSGVSADDDDDVKDIKLSKSQQKEYERKIIAEARRRQAEKYGEEYIETDEDD